MKQSDVWCVKILIYVEAKKNSKMRFFSRSGIPLAGRAAYSANGSQCFYYSPWSITLIIRPPKRAKIEKLILVIKPERNPNLFFLDSF